VIPIRDDNPKHRTPYVAYGIMGLCILVYVWQLALGRQGFQNLFFSLGLIPAVVTGQAALPDQLVLVPPWFTVFTSMFLHGGFFHLAGNLLYLWIFADNVEDVLGHVRFTTFYLLCGVGAAGAQVLPSPDSVIPMVGASGAISGVLAAYLLMFPHARVLVAIPLGFILHMIKLRAVTVLGFWFLLQLLSSLMAPPDSGGVAFRAHLGGFVAGLVLLPLFTGRRRAG
jgi:membrane associated rhomboid family serine protease